MVRTKQSIPRPGVGGLIAHVRHVVELKDAVVAAASEGLVRGIVDCVVGVEVAHPGKRNACVQSSDADIRGSQSHSQSTSSYRCTGKDVHDGWTPRHELVVNLPKSTALQGERGRGGGTTHSMEQGKDI